MCVRERITELKKQWNIRPTPNGVYGVQQSLKFTFRVGTVHLHQLASPNAPFCHTKAVNAKLSGDGANIRHRLHVVNLHSHYSQRPIQVQHRPYLL